MVEGLAGVAAGVVGVEFFFFASLNNLGNSDEEDNLESGGWRRSPRAPRPLRLGLRSSANARLPRRHTLLLLLLFAETLFSFAFFVYNFQLLRCFRPAWPRQRRSMMLVPKRIQKETHNLASEPRKPRLAALLQRQELQRLAR